MAKNPRANAGDTRDKGLIPRLGQTPEKNGNPLQYFLPGKFHGQRSLAVCGGHKLNKELQNPQLLGPGLLPVFLELTSFTKKTHKKPKANTNQSKRSGAKTKKNQTKPKTNPVLHNLHWQLVVSFYFLVPGPGLGLKLICSVTVSVVKGKGSNLLGEVSRVFSGQGGFSTLIRETSTFVSLPTVLPFKGANWHVTKKDEDPMCDPSMDSVSSVARQTRGKGSDSSLHHWRCS